MVENVNIASSHPSCFSLQVGNDSRGNAAKVTCHLLCAYYSNTLFLNESEANSAIEIDEIRINNHHYFERQVGFLSQRHANTS